MATRELATGPDAEVHGALAVVAVSGAGVPSVHDPPPHPQHPHGLEHSGHGDGDNGDAQGAADPEMLAMSEDATGTTTTTTAAVVATATSDPAVIKSHQGPTARPVRGRYAKFTAAMDVLLLEAMRQHNPFTAKHGTRLQMWQNIAETVGHEVLKNPEAYSWHTCRDRVTTLIKLYADGKHDKLFKHGTVEENDRKEAILRELNMLLQRRRGGFRPSPLLDGQVGGVHSPPPFNGSGGKERAAAPRAVHASAIPGQKRRRADSGLSGQLDGETFRSRVLEIIETKIQFDMEQRAKENELREQEFELQKRLLEYLQSK